MDLFFPAAAPSRMRKLMLVVVVPLLSVQPRLQLLLLRYLVVRLEWRQRHLLLQYWLAIRWNSTAAAAAVAVIAVGLALRMHLRLHPPGLL